VFSVISVARELAVGFSALESGMSEKTLQIDVVSDVV
jgi:hypothetical protein